MKMGMKPASLTWLLILVATASAATDGESRHGTFWYIIDNVTTVAADAEAVIWVTLPPEWQGQTVTAGSFVPPPEAILEDPGSGNRIVEWRLAPGALPADQTGALRQFYFRYDFTVQDRSVRKHGPHIVNQQYDRSDPVVRRYTAEEPGLQTDGRIRDLAVRLAGDERDPYLVGRRLYAWVVEHLTFRSGGAPEWDALSILAERKGNCEQFSTLFVALCRSVGIPARTLGNTWTWGGRHVFAEILLPGPGWLPVDPTLGQLLTAGRGGLTEAQVETILAERGVPLGDAGWLYGNAPENRLITALGSNIRFHSPTLDRGIVLRSMNPGGSQADPAGYRLRGFAGDVVHGGFYVFGDTLTEDQAHGLAHQRLSDLFFRTELDEYTEDVCRAASSRYTTGTQNWISLGKSYLHEAEYYKAEAAFRRALDLAERTPLDSQSSLVWIHNYLGNCYDLLARRELAVDQYRKALSFANDFHGAARYARRYLDEPFVAGD